MEKLNFTQANDGWYECEFVAKERNYTVQLNRAADNNGRNNIVVKMKVDADIEPAILKNYDGHTDQNTLITFDCTKGATIIVRSRSEVIDAAIDGEISAGVSFTMIPDEVAELMGLSGNPYFEESSGDAAAMFAFVGAEPTSLSFTIDELTITTPLPPEDEDIIQVVTEPITQEAIDALHNLGVYYFDDKIGQYITMPSIVISHMEGYTPLAAGEHPYSLSANNEEVISGNFTVQP